MKEVIDLEKYVNQVFNLMHKELYFSKLDLMIEYIKLSDTVTTLAIASNGYNKLKLKDEVGIHYKCVESIFDKYVK